MWFLIKACFWFSLVLLVLPVFETGQPTRKDPSTGLDIADAFTAATGAYDYVTRICVEKPDVCEKGASTFAALGVRARDGARIAYDYLDQHFAEDGKAPARATDATPPAIDIALPKKPLADATRAAIELTERDMFPAAPSASPVKPYRAPVSRTASARSAAPEGDTLLTGSIPVPLARPRP